MAKYETATINKDGALVNIRQIRHEDERLHRYYCPNCKDEMIPIVGKVREHHFRHKAQPCRYETYLHSLAEKTFLEEYQKCLFEKKPFFLVFDSVVECNQCCVLSQDIDCKEHHFHKEVDLTNHFIKISLERNVSVGDGRKRKPDILLETEDGRQLWVEIFVTNETKQPKLDDAEKKGAQVVEIKITDEQCKGMTAIQEHKLFQNEGIRFFNMPIKADIPNSETVFPCMKFFVYERIDGKKKTYISKDCPPKPEKETDYSLVLNLNWGGTWSGPRRDKKPISLVELESMCSFQERIGYTQDIHGIIVSEVRLKDSAVSKSVQPSKQRPPQHVRPILSEIPKKEQQLQLYSEAEQELKRMEAIDYTPHYRISNPPEWVDLDLPSGNLWSSTDGESPMSIPEGYVKSTPSRKDIQELCLYCKHQIEGDKACIIGRNGRAISFQNDKYKLSGKGFDKDGPFGYRLKIYSLPNGLLHVIEDYPNADGTYRTVLHRIY